MEAGGAGYIPRWCSGLVEGCRGPRRAVGVWARGYAQCRDLPACCACSIGCPATGGVCRSRGVYSSLCLSAQIATAHLAQPPRVLLGQPVASVCEAGTSVSYGACSFAAAWVAAHALCLVKAQPTGERRTRNGGESPWGFGRWAVSARDGGFDGEAESTWRTHKSGVMLAGVAAPGSSSYHARYLGVAARHNCRVRAVAFAARGRAMGWVA
ncbi:hypothetical protein Tco_0825386 [Tanacetum coccineum]